MYFDKKTKRGAMEALYVSLCVFKENQPELDGYPSIVQTQKKLLNDSAVDDLYVDKKSIKWNTLSPEQNGVYFRYNAPMCSSGQVNIGANNGLFTTDKLLPQPMLKKSMTSYAINCQQCVRVYCRQQRNNMAYKYAYVLFCIHDL